MRQACTKEKRLKIKESMQKTRAKRSKQVCRVFKVKIDSSKLSVLQKEQLKMMFVEGKWIKNDRIAWARYNMKSIFECERPHKHEVVKVKAKDGAIEERKLQFIGSQMAQGVVDDMKSNMKTLIALAKSKKQRYSQLKFCSEIKSLNLCQYGNTYKFITHKKMKTNAESSLAVLKDILPVLEKQEDFSNDALFAVLKSYIQEKGFKNGFVLWPVRIAVSGKQTTPAGATEIMEVLGREESLARIREAIRRLEA